MKFKNDIEVQAGIKDSSGSDGTLGQVLSSTVSGVSWITPSTGITGSGTINFVPKWSSSTGLSNSRIIDNGFGVYIGYTSPASVGSATYALDIITNGTSQSGIKIINSPGNNFHLFRFENLGTGDYIQARSGITGSDVFSVNYLGDTTANSFIKTGGTSSQYLMADGSVSTGPSVSGYVPYTGANQDVDLGVYQLKADSLAISTTSTEAVDAGEIVWNSIDGTFDMGLIGGVTLQAGQEMHIYGKATQAISNGDAVMFAGVQGDHILIAKADAATINANPEYFIGIATQSFVNNQFGYVTVFGNVRGLNTTAYTLGTVLYYDSTTATDGLLTPTEPTAPNAKIEVAAVVKVHATQGILLVRPHVMPKLNDIQDIFAPNPFNNDVLFWNGSSSRYETETIPGILGYNPVPPSRTITINGNTQDLSTNISYTIPTHDPVTIGTANGLSLSVQVLSLGLSSSSANGALSSTDWSTFNSKQNALNGTGFVKVSGTTVTYDNSTYALDSDVVKLTGAQTITGTKTFNVSSLSDAILIGNNGGRGMRIVNASSGFGLIVNNETASTAIPIVVQKSGSTVLSINDSGAINASSSITGSSFVRTGGTSAQILAADGSVITAGTGISISGGTISSTVVGGVTSFNTRTGAVTLTSTDVNTALGYTAANDANVVKLTGDQSILGIKSFNHVNGSVENFTTRLNYFFDNGIIRSDVTPLETINNLTSQSIFKVDKDGNITGNSFVKIGGNSTQYLKADGSVSTAMNSRIEVNFVATAGQTTFTTPYEVGQIDVYYNGSKLYPNEFTATNGTTVVLAQAATLNAQISIVKYVAALSTSAIRNETTFTTTAGQTTFSVNYTVGQLDVFYNGSKLNVSEFTATNGTSVALGFACTAGESIVIVSYVNQVSGASGTANRVAKFTGVASLGDSQIFDNGANVGIGTTNSIAKLTVLASNSIGSSIPTGWGSIVSGRQGVVRGNNSVYLDINPSLPIAELSTYDYGSASAIPITLQGNGGNVLIGTTTDNGNRFQVNGNSSFSGNVGIGTNSPTELVEIQRNQNATTRLLVSNSDTTNASSRASIRTNSNGVIAEMVSINGLAVYIGAATNHELSLMTNGSQRLVITPGGTLGVNSSGDVNNAGIDKLSIGYFNGNYGWLQSWAGTSLYLNKAGNAVYAGTQRIDNNSDERIKENIVPIQKALDTVLLLKGKKYNMLDEDNILRYGFIAQEVQPHLSDFVTESNRTFEKDNLKIENLLTLESSGTAWAALLVEAIKEQNQQIQELKAEIEILKNK